MKTYKKRHNPSRRQLSLIDGDTSDLGETAIRRACNDIREHPRCLPLWAYRLAQWVNRGHLNYEDVWQRLRLAALSAGADESWVNRALFRSFADSAAQRSEPMPLNVLAGGLH